MKEKILGNRYKIIDKIGKGGMALVYKAYDTRLTREVAIKVLRHELVEDSEFKKRFLREAQSAAKLFHQNIVSVFDVDEFENINYIVMEYVDGKSLKDLLNEKGTMSYEMAINTTIKICDAIQCAHEVGIIHRDIKPQNIMIKKDGSVKVTDFGIAKYIAATTITQDGNLMGSVHYLSPERILGLKPDNRADIYSIGITFYEMLVGIVPFNGENPVAVMSQHVKDKPNVDILAKYVPTSLLNIVLKTLNKEPEDRYQSAKELKDVLVNLLCSNELNIVDGGINKKYEEELKKDLSKMIEKESEPVEINKDNNEENRDNIDEFTKTVAYVSAPGSTETFIDIKTLKKDINREEVKKDNVEFIKFDSVNVDEDNNKHDDKDINEMNSTSKTEIFNTIKTIEVGKFVEDLSKDKKENDEEEIFNTIQAPFIEKIDNNSLPVLLDKHISKNDNKLETEKEMNNKVDSFSKKQVREDNNNDSSNNSAYNYKEQVINNKDKSNNKFIIVIALVSMLIIVGLIVIAVILIGIINNNNVNASDVKQDENVKFINYENQEYGISFTYPETWNKTENESNYFVIINSIDSETNNIDESISIGVKDLFLEIPIDSVSNGVLETLLETLTGEDINSNNIEDDLIAGHDSKKIEINKNNKNNTLWLLQDDGKIYYIDYLISNEKSTENMDEVINSIKISN